jgi:hypothetical protein
MPQQTAKPMRGEASVLLPGLHSLSLFSQSPVDTAAAKTASSNPLLN